MSEYLFTTIPCLHKQQSSQTRNSFYTVPPASTVSTSLFPHIVMLQPYSQWIQFLSQLAFLLLKIVHTTPHNDNNFLCAKVLETGSFCHDTQNM